MKKKLVLFLIGTIGILVGTSQADAAEIQEMHRVYNPNSGEHFYTANVNEKNKLINLGWKYEGIGWYAPKAGADVYRLYNPNAGDHHYTMYAYEKDNLVKAGWKYEGVGWKSDEKKSVALYRAYNPNAKAGSHNYTVNQSEQDNLIRLGWKNEGLAWYGVLKDANTGDQPVQPDPGPEVQAPVITFKNRIEVKQSQEFNFNDFIDVATDENGQSLDLNRIQWKVGESFITTNKYTPANVGTLTITAIVKYGNNQKVTVQTMITVTEKDPIQNPTPDPTMTVEEQKIADEIFELTNKEREKVGVAPLQRSFELTQGAAARSKEVWATKNHTRPNGSSFGTILDDLGYLEYKKTLRVIGENLIGDYSYNLEKGKEAERLVQRWMDSPGHKQNILASYYSNLGVGVEISPSGDIASIQMFGDPVK